MEEPLHTAMFTNPDHIPSLLLQAHNQVDAEQYETAKGILKAIFKINPHHAGSWALQAAIHTVRNEPDKARSARESGLKYWKTNPLVDHEIGKKLSSKYLFTEGAAHQRQALAFSKDYIPAKTQLAQDLLRLGQDEEGWKLAGEAHDADGYDVTTFNLLTLHESLKKYVTIDRNGFLLRMTSDEAALYGDEAIDLLTEARGLFSKKYDTQIEGSVIVEIFPEKKDFAVRTFGIPGGDGYMGVCFGRLITANSPKSLVGFQQNWQSLLWHEYCHVITLQKTRNKMPRWFSEGISETKIGRGHHHRGFTLWMAGGGLKKGLSYGGTDELGMNAIENPVHVHDVHATILHLFGIDHENLTFYHNGIQRRLTNVHGQVLYDCLA